MAVKSRYGVINVVWGEDFTRLMADVTLPTNLSPGNLPALSQVADVTYHIYCTEESEITLRNAAIFPKLIKTVPVEFHRIDSSMVCKVENYYGVLTDSHRRAVRVARERREDLVILSPDAIWSDGSFLRMHELARGGARAVMIAAPRAYKADFLRSLEAALPDDISSGIVLGHRELMRLMLDNLHTYTKDLIWYEDRISSWPSQLLWRIGERDLMIRAFHLHPFLIRPMDWDGEMPSEIDGEYVANAVTDHSLIHVVLDSDEIAVCELTTSLRGTVHLASPNTDSGTKRVAGWMRRNTSSLHRRYVETPIRLHAGEIDDAQEESWQSTEARSARVLARINRDYEQLKRRIANENRGTSTGTRASHAS